MKTSNMYLNRLLKLSDALLALEKRNPGKIYIASENGISIEHFHWCLDLVPGHSRKLGSYVNSGSRKHEILYSLANYFSLTADQVLHLFAVDCQDECYNGSTLVSTSGPVHLAHNILEFVKIIEAESSIPVIELYPKKRENKNKVLTFKTNKHEEKNYAMQYH